MHTFVSAHNLLNSLKEDTNDIILSNIKLKLIHIAHYYSKSPGSI